MTTFTISSAAFLAAIMLRLGDCNSLLTSYPAPHSPFSKKQSIFFLKCKSGQIPQTFPAISAKVFPWQLQQDLGSWREEREKKS